MSEQKAFLCAVLGNAIFGFSFIFSKMVLEVASPIVMLSVRFVVAFLLMTAIRPFLKHKLCYKGKKIWMLLVLGLVQPVAYFLCESYGLKYATSSFAGSIIALLPIFCMGIAAVALGERTTLFQKICIVASVAGVIITTLGKSEGTATPLGFVLLLGAALSGAVCQVLLRRMSQEFTPFEQNYVMFGFGCVVFSAMALFQCRADLAGSFLVPMASGKFWISMAYLGGLSSIGAFLLTTMALTRLPASLVSPVSSVTTVVSIFAGVLFLHENFTLVQGIGSIIIIASTYLINNSATKAKKLPEAMPKEQESLPQ